MLVKIFGIFDITVGLIFWLFGIFHLSFMANFVFLLGLIIIAKGAAFSIKPNITSMLDIISGIIIVSATYAVFPRLVIIIVSLFLIQKGVLSLLG